MTDKEMHKLSRRELLQLLLAQVSETEELRAALAERDDQLAALSENYERLRKRLDQKDAKIHDLRETLRKDRTARRIELQEAGSIAEAALRLNGIFELAQKAADQYLANVRILAGDLEPEDDDPDDPDEPGADGLDDPDEPGADGLDEPGADDPDGPGPEEGGPDEPGPDGADGPGPNESGADDLDEPGRQGEDTDGNAAEAADGAAPAQQEGRKGYYGQEEEEGRAGAGGACSGTDKGGAAEGEP